MSCSKQKAPAVSKPAVKTPKAKYALIFFEEKREQSVVPMTLIIGEATVGERRQVKWEGELLECLIVLTGTNKGALSKVDLDRYGRLVEKDKGPNSAESIAKRNISMGEKKVQEARHQLAVAKVADKVANKSPLIISQTEESQQQPMSSDSSNNSTMGPHPSSNQSQQGYSRPFYSSDVMSSYNQPGPSNSFFSPYGHSFNPSSPNQEAFLHNVSSGMDQRPDYTNYPSGMDQRSNYTMHPSRMDQRSDHSVYHPSYPPYCNYQQGHDSSNPSANPMISTNEGPNYGTHGTTHLPIETAPGSLTVLSGATTVPTAPNNNTMSAVVSTAAGVASALDGEPSTSHSVELAAVTKKVNDFEASSGADSAKCGLETNPAVNYFQNVIVPLATPEKLDFLKKITAAVEMALQHPSQPSTSGTPTTTAATYPADLSWDPVSGKHRVELVPLSGVWVDKRERDAIVTKHKSLKPDAQEMLRHLIRVTIGDENLVSMNTSGKKGQFRAFPSSIFEIVKKFVKMQFPNDAEEHSKFTKTANNYCGGLRRKQAGPVFSSKRVKIDNESSKKPLTIRN